MEKFCVNCGQKMAADVMFCPNCGAKQPEQTSTTNESNNQQANQQSTSFSNATSQMTDGDTINTVGFMPNIKYAYAHLFDFGTKTKEQNKGAFWWDILGLTILGVAFSLIYTILLMISVGLAGFFYFVYVIFQATCMIAPTMRRLNYLGKDKNLAWLHFVPLVNLYIFYLMLIDKNQA